MWIKCPFSITIFHPTENAWRKPFWKPGPTACWQTCPLDPCVWWNLRWYDMFCCWNSGMLDILNILGLETAISKANILIHILYNWHHYAENTWWTSAYLNVLGTTIQKLVIQSDKAPRSFTPLLLEKDFLVGMCFSNKTICLHVWHNMNANEQQMIKNDRNTLFPCNFGLASVAQSLSIVPLQ